MKEIFYILMFSILTSCQTKTSDRQEEFKSDKVGLVDDSSKQSNESDEQIDSPISVKDSSDYSPNFLKEMEQTEMKQVSLADSFLILCQTDTIIFPQTPEIGKKILLTAVKDKLAIALTIERINQTTIDYKLEMVEFGNTSFNSQGQADLSPYFYLGAETDESSLSGVSYLSTQFNDNQDSCYTYIRLGKGEESGPYLLGKLIKNCNGKLKNIDLENFPTLVEK